MKTVLVLFSIIWCTSAFVSISLNQCQRSKACFKTSKTCTMDQCDFVVTWKPAKHNGKNYLEIEMVGVVQSTGGYIAMGFSEDKSMGDDGVVACYASPGSPRINVVAGYNEPRNNIILSDTQVDKDFLVTSDEKLYGGSFYSNINKVACRFLRLMTPETNADKLKDLGSGKKYYLFVAKGPDVNLNGLNKHFPGSNIISEIAIDFTSGSYNTVVGSSGINSPLAKAHGIIMIIAWMFCCAIAVIIARYYKNVWSPDNMREGTWFNAHRGLQGCAFILVIIAIILIVVHVGGYSRLEDFPSKLHPIFGFIIVILFIINPFVALCRCSLYHKNRPIFNWIHFFIGIIAYVLCIPTIMIGLKLPGAGLALSQLNYPQWIVFIFVIFQVLIEVILEIHGCMIYRRNKDKRHAYEMEKREYEKALLMNLKPTQEPNKPLQTGRSFKLFILGLYISVCIIIVLTLIIIIIVH